EPDCTTGVVRFSVAVPALRIVMVCVAAGPEELTATSPKLMIAGDATRIACAGAVTLIINGIDNGELDALSEVMTSVPVSIPVRVGCAATVTTLPLVVMEKT